MKTTATLLLLLILARESVERRFSSQLERAKERFEIRAAVFVVAAVAAAAKMRRLSLLATLLLHLLYTASVCTYKRMPTLAS
uniref:Secreted protein n=1 Tax=Trichogramma kaykai TaxID=54128 RepID=A0ABD2WSP9_9HYME